MVSVQPSLAEEHPEGLEGTLLNGVSYESAIFDFPPFFLCNRLTGSKVLIAIFE